MKRLLWVFFAGLLLNVHVFAQWDDYGDYDSEGYDEGQSETGAPEGVTNITVTNTGNEDLTEQKLTLPNNQPIYLYFYNSVQSPPPPEPAAPVAPAAPVEAAKTAPPPEPVFVPPPPPVEERCDPPPKPPIEYRFIPSPPPAVEYRYIPPPPPPTIEYVYLPPPPVEYVYVPAPVVEPIVEPVYEPPQMRIRVIPCLPNPDSPKIYRIQVGSYAAHNAADVTAQRLITAGLQAGIEYYNSLKRVFVPGVRAADAVSVVRMLEFLGFQEVWIRE